MAKLSREMHQYLIWFPSSHDGVGIPRALRRHIAKAWMLAQSATSERIPTRLFLKSALEELSKRDLIRKIPFELRGELPLWDLPEVVQFEGPVWIRRWEVDWKSVWFALTPTWKDERLQWEQRSEVIPCPEMILRNAVAPGPFG